MSTLQREYLGRRVVARFKTSERTRSTCRLCGGSVHRSWVTQILHAECRACRYLVMMYGPSIRVARIPRTAEPATVH